MWMLAVQLTRLPDRVRPGILGFGTLADGFFPFELPGRSVPGTLQMTSVVMKAVQAHAEKLGAPAQVGLQRLGIMSALCLYISLYQHITYHICFARLMVKVADLQWPHCNRKQMLSCWPTKSMPCSCPCLLSCLPGVGLPSLQNCRQEQPNAQTGMLPTYRACISPGTSSTCNACSFAQSSWVMMPSMARSRWTPGSDQISRTRSSAWP